MPRVLISPTAVTRDGVAPPAESTPDVAQGNYIPNSGSVYVLLRNSNGSATVRNLTVAFANGVDGQTVTPRPYAVDAGDSMWIGPFPVTTYGAQLNVNADNTELKISAIQVA